MITIPARTLNVTSIEDGITSSNSLSGKRYTRRRGNIHKWQLEISTPPRDSIEMHELNAALVALRGSGVAQLKSPLKNHSATNSAVTVSDLSVGDSTVSLSGLPVNTVKALVADTKIQFSNHDKVYNIDSSVDSSATGSATISITPPLIKNVIGGAQVVINDVVFVVEKLEFNESFSLNVGSLQRKSVKFLEVV